MATHYLNCDQIPLTQKEEEKYKSQDAPKRLKNGKIINKIKCNSCGTKYIVYTDGIHMPAKYSGQDSCKCGQVLMEYNTTEEPFLFEVEN